MNFGWKSKRTRSPPQKRRHDTREYDMPSPITTAQKRCIYALAKKYMHMSDDDIHAMTYQIAGMDHVSDMTLGQAKGMIDRLKRMAGQESNATRPGKPTPRELGMIMALAENLGWTDERLRAFIEKRFHISHLRFVDDKTARKLIEALKAMEKGNRGERRLTNHDRDTKMVT